MRALRPVFLLVLAALGPGCSGGGGSGGPSLTAQIESFGLVRADVVTARQIALLNPFAEEAVIDRLEPASGGFAVAAGAFPLVVGARQSRSIDVTFTPGSEPVASGSMLVQFKVGDRLAQVRVRFDATIEVSTVALLTAAAAFGDVFVDESASRPVTVRNTSVVTPVRIFTPTSLPAGITLPGAARTIAPGASSTLTVDWAPTAIASRDFDVELRHDASGPALVVHVTAQATTWRPEQIVDFGPVALTDGETEWLEVEVPPHGVSISIEALAADTTIGLLGFEGPGGHVYENDTATGDFLWFEGEEVFTATVPSSDRPALRLVPGGGTYRFRLYRMAGSAGSFDIRVIVHNRPGGTAQGGVVDLNVFLADGLGIDLADAPSEARLVAILAEADRIFSQHDLRLGSVSYYALTDPGFDQITTETQFGDLLLESGRGVAGRLSLFFVLQTLGGGAVGVAPRIAGPSSLGTSSSGVMVDYDWGTPAQSGYVTAHEVGHFLGLLHTTDKDGEFDLVDDTPECPPTGTSATCTTEGDSNLMHWRVLSVDPRITEGQRIVLLGHPLVGPPSPQLTVFEPAPAASPLIAAAVPQGWCGTRGCRTSAK